MKNRRLKYSWRSQTSVLQNLMESLYFGLILGEPNVRAMDGAICSSPLIPNETFGPRHDFSPVC